VFKRDPEAYWFDDYKELVDEYSPLAELAGVDAEFF